MDQTQMFFKDVMNDLQTQWLTIFPWDVHSLAHRGKTDLSQRKNQKHVIENKITSVILCDFII